MKACAIIWLAPLEKLSVKEIWSAPRYESWKIRLSGRYSLDRNIT